jgi:hypothetical protein
MLQNNLSENNFEKQNILVKKIFKIFQVLTKYVFTWLIVRSFMLCQFMPWFIKTHITKIIFELELFVNLSCIFIIEWTGCTIHSVLSYNECQSDNRVKMMSTKRNKT